MHIDWLTAIAQIVNFLILVLLLKRFLYGPILKAMDSREKGISARAEEAKRHAEEAQREKEDYSRRLREFDVLRQQMLAQVHEEAESLRKELQADARHEVDVQRSGWLGASARERDLFVRGLSERVTRAACSIARRAVSELSSATLEQCIVERMIAMLPQLSEAERTGFIDAVCASGRCITATSSFDVPQALRENLLREVRQHLIPDAEIRFERSEDSLCGIRLSAGGRTIPWNLEDYISDLEEQLIRPLG